jgi:DNA polymerase-3 subunit alpha
VHLHVHTEYSLLDGAIRTGDLARRVAGWAASGGCPSAVAITDHGEMYGVVEFYENCRAAGVKPIIGCEMYVAPEGYRSNDAPPGGQPGQRKARNNHLILLAENDAGYHNLVKLVSIANTEGFYYKPRIDHSLLAQYSRGLICSSACLAGEIPELILAGLEGQARDRAMLYRDIMGEGNFFLEIMYNSIPEQAVVNKALVRISSETGIPLIATGDAHYLDKEDYDWHKVLLKINTGARGDADSAAGMAGVTGGIVNPDDAFGFNSNDFYLRTPEEMNGFFAAELPEALDNTAAIAERCSVDFKLSSGEYLLPSLDLEDGMTPETHLESEARAGLKIRLSENGITDAEPYRDRLEFELGVINKMGFAGYFLIVSGIIRAAKERSIPIGPGRGSAAGSLVAWSLRVTELDPIRHGLLFERFLNPERVSMPDIDTDVSDKGRDELLKYIVDRYGSDRVSQIITLGHMNGRSAVKDAGRAMGVAYAKMDKMAKLIPSGPSHVALTDALAEVPELKAMVDGDPELGRVFEVASKIEGLARHPSQHAAGVVIAPVPITDLVPVRGIKGDEKGDATVIQYEMGSVEKLGLVKMDILGLRNLSIIEDALANIRDTGKTPPDMAALPSGDEPTYRMLQNADTLGIFQLESDGMRRLLLDLKVDCFDDLVAVLAMYRPGPLGSGMVRQYVDCKHGRAKPAYPHPLLEPVLKDTHGVILYQEQVMQCASVLAGYTLGEADILRRAMGKKKKDEMERQREKFVSGASARDIDRKTAEHIFDLIQEFAGYGFNKSHSAAYAVIAYQTAYLKANYRAEFMAAYLSSQMKDKKENLGYCVRATRQSGVKVLPPDVNSSMDSFTATSDGVIRFGLGAVAHVGRAVDAILEARDSGGRFKSLWDFVTRVQSVPRSAVENLIRAGAFDEVNPNRARLLAALPNFIAAAQKVKRDESQYALFGGAETPAVDETEPDMPEVEEQSIFDRLSDERKVTGLYMSGHPFEQYEEKAWRHASCSIGDLQYWRSRDVPARVGGMVVSLTEKQTKSGSPMGIMKFEDAEEEVEMVAFPKSWENIKGITSVNAAYLAEGRYNEDRGNFIVDKLTPLDDVKDDAPGIVRIRLTLGSEGKEKFDVPALADALKKCAVKGKGVSSNKSPVYLEISSDDEFCVVWLKGAAVRDSEALREALSAMNNVHVRSSAHDVREEYGSAAAALTPCA